MIGLVDVNLNTAVIGAASALAGWVLRDVRNRLKQTEYKMEAVVVALFYIIVNDPKIPDDARASIRKAMLPMERQ